MGGSFLKPLIETVLPAVSGVLGVFGKSAENNSQPAQQSQSSQLPQNNITFTPNINITIPKRVNSSNDRNLKFNWENLKNKIRTRNPNLNSSKFFIETLQNEGFTESEFVSVIDNIINSGETNLILPKEKIENFMNLVNKFSELFM